MEGILPVHKPKDWTSHDVVQKIRRLTRIKRIGHAGTLDPQVTGVLPLCIGKATRVVEYMQELPKEYEVTMLLGYATDTEDTTGTVLQRVEQVDLSPEQIRQAILSFTGTIEQMPPMYSAVKVAGKKLYEYAREGIHVERNSRNVMIYQIDIHDIRLTRPYPEIHFTVRCSKGTYIRTLCSDIGKRLGVPAVMSHLVRTLSGNITLDQSYTIEEIVEFAETNQLKDRLIPADQTLTHLPPFHIHKQDAKRAAQGQKISIQCILEDRIDEKAGINIRLYSDDHIFIGIFQLQEEGHSVVPQKVFVTF